MPDTGLIAWPGDDDGWVRNPGEGTFVWACWVAPDSTYGAELTGTPNEDDRSCFIDTWAALGEYDSMIAGSEARDAVYGPPEPSTYALPREPGGRLVAADSDAWLAHVHRTSCEARSSDLYAAVLLGASPYSYRRGGEDGELLQIGHKNLTPRGGTLLSLLGAAYGVDCHILTFLDT